MFFDIETELKLNWFVYYRTVLTFNCVKTKSILILNWFSWIRTEKLDIEMFFRIKLYLHLNCILILNWIVWNRTICIKMDLALNNLQMLICRTTNQQTINSLATSRYLSFFSLSILFSGQLRQESLQWWKFSFFFWMSKKCDSCRSHSKPYKCLGINEQQGIEHGIIKHKSEKNI